MSTSSSPRSTSQLHPTHRAESVATSASRSARHQHLPVGSRASVRRATSSRGRKGLLPRDGDGIATRVSPDASIANPRRCRNERVSSLRSDSFILLTAASPITPNVHDGT
ncbi:unnamed protein product [Lampetra fluviatilis]